MRFIFAIIGWLSLVFIPAQAQQENIHWALSVQPNGKGNYSLVVKAKVAQGWHLYSQTNPPNKTVFQVILGQQAPKDIVFSEPKPKKVNDEYLGPTAYFEEHNVTFKKDLDLCNLPPNSKIQVNVLGQICTEDAGMCLPFDKSYSISFSPSAEVCGSNPATSDATTAPEATEGAENDFDGDGVVDSLDLCQDKPGPKESMGCPDSDGDGVHDGKDQCPGVASDRADGCPEGGSAEAIWGSGNDPERLTNQVRARVREDGGCTGADNQSKTPWGIFLAGFLGGLLALLTPCVFPMVPMTVAFFTKQSSSRAKGIANAATYALSIIVIYTGLGFAITKIFGSDALNAMATSAFWNLLFFFIFVVFAISFLGAFEIMLPNKLLNAVDKKANKGGLVGIFFMAFTLSLVSFSCTGPLIGTLLVEAANTGNNVAPLMGMFGFSVALALPFALFAAFPGWLNTLPKAGGWMTSVKVSLGLLELALALKFLSTVDMAYHWDFLFRERFLAMWIAIFSLLTLYLLGIFKTAHDSSGETKLSVPRIFLAVISLSFTLYLIPGLTGAPLKLLAGLAPPPSYTESAHTNAGGGHCPMGLDCFNDLAPAMEAARERNKPIFIDFTGYGCTNCRLMEENVWTQGKNMELLRDKFVVVSLFCDDKRSIPEHLQKISPVSGKPMTTIGKVWSDFEIYHFKQQSQPLYVVMDGNGKLLSETYGYEPDGALFQEWLECALKRHK